MDMYDNKVLPKIRKKDGRVEQCTPSKIFNAALKALLSLNLTEEDSVEKATEVTRVVVLSLGSTGATADYVTYDEVHDLVEYALMDVHKPAAKAYIKYRKSRFDIREQETILLKAVGEASKETSKENANIQNSPASKLFEVGCLAEKSYVVNFLLKSRHARLHEEGSMHIHDLPYYMLTYNCVAIAAAELLAKGFKLNHGMINPPKSIISATPLIAILFQSAQNDQFGGVSIDRLDEVLAPYTEGASDEVVFQACEALVYNLCTLHSRAGNQVPFTSVSIGLGTSVNERRVAMALLDAYDAGLGRGEQPIFPNIMVKVKDGYNKKLGDPNFDILERALAVASRRLNPTFINMDASFNAPYGLEPSYMGCRSRVVANINGPEITGGRGNVSFTTMNLPKLALESRLEAGGLATNARRVEIFYTKLNELLQDVEDQLLHRWNLLRKLRVKDIPFNMSQVYLGSTELEPLDMIEPALKNGTHTFGFVGLAETLIALVGKHHGEDVEANNLGMEIVKRIRDYADFATKKHHLNFSVIGSPAEGVCDRFAKMNKAKFGEVEGVTDKGYITNSMHVPVEYPLDVLSKAKIEGPYHTYQNGGHIFYSEFKEAPINNVEGLYSILMKVFNEDVGYMGFNYDVDFCDDCGYIGILNKECTACGSTNIKQMRRVSGYLGELDNINESKANEIEARRKHYNVLGK